MSTLNLIHVVVRIALEHASVIHGSLLRKGRTHDSHGRGGLARHNQTFGAFTVRHLQSDRDFRSGLTRVLNSDSNHLPTVPHFSRIHLPHPKYGQPAVPLA